MKFNKGSWNLWRSTRLVLGIIFIGIGLFQLDYILAAAGLFLIVHAWINSCAACQTGACEIPQQTQNGKLQ